MPGGSGAKTVGKLLILLGADTTKFQQAMSAAEKRLRKTGRAFETAGMQMMRGFTIPLAGIGAAAFKFSADFDKAMSQSVAIMGDLSQALEEDLAATARATAKETTFAAREMAGAYFYLASAGLDAAQSMAALPQVARFATAGQFDLQRATDLLTDAQSAMGLTVKDASKNLENMRRVSDALVKANVLANASVEQFSSSLTNKAGPAMRALGMEIEEGLAILAAFADQGIKGEEAGTQLMIALRELQEASGKSAAKFKALNISVYDGRGEFRKMADIIGEMETALGTMSDEQRRATLEALGFESKSIAAMNALMGYSAKIRDWEAAIREAGGVTDQVANRQLANLADRFTMLKNQFVDVAITLGKALTPGFDALSAALSGLGRILGAVADVFGRLPKVLRVLVTLNAAFLAGIGPLLFGIGMLIRAISSTTAALKQLAIVMTFVNKHPLVALATVLAAVAITFGAFALGAKKAGAATEDFSASIEANATAVQKAQRAYEGYQTSIAQTKSALKQARNDWVAAKRLLDSMAQSKLEGSFVGRGMVESQAKEAVETLSASIVELEKRLVHLRDTAAAARLDLNVETAREAYAAYSAELDKGLRAYRATGDEVQKLNNFLTASETLFETLTGLEHADEAVLRQLATTIADVRQQRDGLIDSQRKAAALTESLAKAEKDYAESMRQAQVIFEATGDQAEFLGNKLQALEGYFQDLAAAPGASREELKKTATQIAALRTEVEAASKVPLKLTIAFSAEDLSLARDQWNTFLNDLAISAQDIVTLLTDLFEKFAQGFGTAIANVIVYGQDFGEAMKALGKDLLATLITALIRLGIEQIAFMILSIFAITKETTSKMAAYAMQTYAAAYAASIGPLTAMALFAGPGLAAAFAAGAVATMLAGAGTASTAGSALGATVGLAEGGVVMEPVLTPIAEAGPEVVLPLDRLGQFLPREGNTEVYLQVDGRTLAQLVVPHMPTVVRKTIGRRTL